MQGNKGVFLILIMFFSLITSGCQSSQNKAALEQYRREGWDLDHFITTASSEFSQPKTDYQLSAEIQLQKAENGINELSYHVVMQYNKINLKGVTLSFSLHPDMADKLGIYSMNAVVASSIPYLPNGGTKVIVSKDSLSIRKPFGLAVATVDNHFLAIYKLLYVKVTYSIQNEQKIDYYKLEVTPSTELSSYLKSL